ncbi:MAG: four helix bundle protein [Acidobacteriales bacterium]|nr:four helix bundle protein [Terriglobales bacterium]
MSLDKHLELRKRTKEFALRIFKVTQSLPSNRAGWVFGDQLLRCGTSVAANYRACGRSRSRAEFISKISICLEEADEAVFWLEMLYETGLFPESKLKTLIQEANELVAIFNASRTSARSAK